MDSNNDLLSIMAEAVRGDFNAKQLCMGFSQFLKIGLLKNDILW